MPLLCSRVEHVENTLWPLISSLSMTLGNKHLSALINQGALQFMWTESS